MSNFKCILSLLTLIAGAATLAVSLYFGDVAKGKTARLALADFSTDVCVVRLERKGDLAIVLERREGAWSLREPFVGSADPRVVMKFVDALMQTPVVDVVSDSELLRLGRTRADFALEDPAVRVELRTDGGETGHFAFGATTPAGDGVYAAVDDVGAVYAVAAAMRPFLAQSADDFRLRSLSSVEAKSVVSLVVKRETASLLEFVRKDDDWTVGGEKASSREIAHYVDELTAAGAVSFLWPIGASNETSHASASLLAGYGLDPDSAVTVTLNGGDGSSCRISFGKSVGEKELVYALVQNGNAVVTVPAALKDFVSRDAALFKDARIFPVDSRSVDGFSVADDDGLYTLSRRKDGRWSLESPIAAPADAEVVEGVLARILALSTSDVVAHGVSVSIATNLQKAVVSRESVMGRMPFERFRSCEMLRIDPALVKRIVSTPGRKGSVPVSVVYDRERRQWSVESDGQESLEVRVGGIEEILAAVNPLTAQRVAKLNVAAADLAGFGLDAPFLTVAIDRNSDDAVRRNILIGKKTKGGRFATIGSSDAVFVVSEATVSRLSASVVGN